MDLARLRELIGIFQTSDLTEMEIEEEGGRVRLSKVHPAMPAQQPVLMHVSAPATPPPATSAHSTAPAGEAEATAEPDEGVVTVDSPMVGVFYAGPTPAEPPFVKPGDTVEAGQTVCIVEAMKLMNEVSAKFASEIVSVLVENGEPVEYNQPLFAVRPLEQA